MIWSRLAGRPGFIEQPARASTACAGPGGRPFPARSWSRIEKLLRTARSFERRHCATSGSRGESRARFQIHKEDAMGPMHAIVRRLGGRLSILSCLALLGSSALCAQQAAAGPAADKETLQVLLKRIDRLEARVSQLEAERQRPEAAIAAPSTAPAISAPTAVAAPAAACFPGISQFHAASSHSPGTRTGTTRKRHVRQDGPEQDSAAHSRLW